MALFSLLIAILVERLKLLPQSWQFDSLMSHYHPLLFGDKQLQSGLMMLIAMSLPTVGAVVLLWVIEGWLWGGVTLFVWLFTAILCFCHQQQRQAFKAYIQAACRGDVQACYHFANELDSSICIDSTSEDELGELAGKSAAWINYRFYGAVALYLMALGPVGIVFYCTVRFYAEYAQRKEIELPLVKSVLHILDWIPSRIVSFGYVLSGEFAPALTVWRKKVLSVTLPARELVIDVAVSAEDLPEVSSAPVCLRPTLALLQLSKRNFMLLVTSLSLLTIFGVVS
ncbi:beta-lactamase regulator AmpE [Shewanella gelidii]|uniref:Beta-lactamase regulator AmpE n=1 Tax=Shewanella gelidii TaxID=1642821 RepID=A0A917N9N6_9GAMM|nr:beta-lactamase regulator AmpE [Shewanella gelidii]MCL1099536.1 beta-lactamase regulator AmpE [Shewanella gelidii]GGI80833.1 beta-lactamase regulator AmpE [Shewanella gelidii]